MSFHTLQAQSVIRSLGFDSEIYTLNPGLGLVDRVQPLSELRPHRSKSAWLCYQASIGSAAADFVASHSGEKIVDYHNVTPAELVEGWMPSLGEEVRLGREQVASLADSALLGMGVSPFNVRELDQLGYRRTVLASLMFDHSSLQVPPDPAALERLAALKSAGGADWLFVGQMLPHKAHHDVVMAFGVYLRAYDPSARLHIVGRESCAPYAIAVRKLAEELGLSRSVHFAGSVGTAELAAMYEACDLYVCCSEHEGFGATLLEAMHHGLPVVAYGAAAVPETVGDGGLVLPSKQPALVAAAAQQVLGDGKTRRDLVRRGRARAAAFTLERAREEFAAAIRLALAVAGAG